MMKPQINKKEFRVARKVGLRKMIKSFTRYFDKLCPGCKRIVLGRPKDAFQIMKRCKKCRDLINDIDREMALE